MGGRGRELTHVKPLRPALAILAWMKKRYALVVMAASAGGVPAFQKVLGALPPDFPLPIAIVQHRTAT